MLFVINTAEAAITEFGQFNPCMKPPISPALNDVPHVIKQFCVGIQLDDVVMSLEGESEHTISFINVTNTISNIGTIFIQGNDM